MTLADLRIIKTVSQDPAVPGQPLSYLLTISNYGPSDATDVHLIDTIPTCIISPIFTVDGIPQGTWTGSYTLGTLPVAIVRVIFITGTVDPFCTEASIINTATVTSPTPDPSPADRTMTITTPLSTSANLRITKTASPDPAYPGQPLTYTLTITNNGPALAQTVQLTDTLPTCLTDVTYRINPGTYAPWPGNPIALGSIPPATSVVVDIQGIINPSCSGNISNTASVTSPTPDPTPSTRTTTIDTLIDTLASLVITKTDNPDPVVAGETLSYTLTVTNNGPSDAQAVELTDAVPACVTSPQYSKDGFTWSPWNGAPYSLGLIKSGVTTTLRIRGIVHPACLAPLLNTATITSPTSDPTPTNRTTTIGTQVATSARLSITKTDNPDPVLAGETLTYTITVTNNGPSYAQTVNLTDALNTCMTSSEYQIDGGGWNPWSGGPEPLGTMTPGDAITVAIRSMIATSCIGNITNTAKVESSTPDPIPSNRTTTIGTIVHSLADLRITKIDNPDPVIAGELLTYILDVINNGPSDALDVVLKDNLPACVTTPEYSTDGGTNWNPWLGTLSLGTLIPSATATVTIRGMVDPNCLESITNIATLESSTPPLDPNDRTTSQTTTVQTFANLTITKTASPDPVPTEDVLTYTITITNAGPSTAKNTALLDSLSTCLLDATYSFDQLTWAPWTGVLPLGNITPATTITLYIQGEITTDCIGTITNTASIASPTPPGNDPDRTTTIGTPVISLASIAKGITTTSNVTIVTLDDTITYTTTLLNTAGTNTLNVVFNNNLSPATTNTGDINIGGTNALNVVFKDNLSPATTFVPNSVIVNGVTVNNADITKGVNVGTIPPGEQAVIQYSAKVISGVSNGEIINDAYATFYQVIHTKRCCPVETPHTFTVVKVTVANFKQLSLGHTLKLATNQPPIEAIDESISEIIIKDYYVVNVPKSTSIEGQRLSGYKLVIHGMLKVSINYTSALVDQSLYTADWMMPFSTFIVLPTDYVPGQLFEVTAVIENTDTLQLDSRTIDVDVTIYMSARRN